MKIRATLPLIMTLISTGLWMGCNPERKENKVPLHPSSTLSDSLTASVAEALHVYFALQDALVNAESIKADSAAYQLKNKILLLQNAIVIQYNMDSVFAFRIRQGLDTILFNLDAIIGAKDESCETKRIYFSPLSSTFYHFLKEIKASGLGAYYTLCPTALNEREATWLNPGVAIRNPYYGKKMLVCGVIIDTL